MRRKHPVTLAIDIGATSIKMMILDADARPLTHAIQVLTPIPATYKAVCDTLSTMIQSFSLTIDRVAAGFPGVVQQGVIKTAPNLHRSWIDIRFQRKLAQMTGVPAIVINDAAVQGYWDIRGKGVELMITLGTGVGSALFMEGTLVPNMQLAHHPFLDNNTYEELLGMVALKTHGIRKWRMHLKKAIALWDMLFNYDKLYIGGGYAHAINFALPPRVQIANNTAGLLGCVKIWDSLIGKCHE